MVYASVLQDNGYDPVMAETAKDAARLFHEAKPCVTILDLSLPDADGLELMKECLAARPEAHFIVITANGSINHAVEAMRAGAYEFLVKPFDEQRMLHAIQGAKADIRRMRAQRDKGVLQVPIEGFVGSSQAMREVYARIRSVGRSMATVFISGESGTGKELCARAIHDHSNRASEPFISLNCGAIPASQLESELFGHLKGAIPGAGADHIGALAAADGGTLFLDDICEMDLSHQTKLLRFIQTSTISPIGSTRARKVNVRIVCATARDPVEEVRLGRFREDLFYRLHVVPIQLPTLRRRESDVLEVAEAVLKRFSQEEGRHFTDIAEDVRQLFLNHNWPGNVRQLLNVIHNVIVLNDGPVITMSMLPPELLNDPSARGERTDQGAAFPPSPNLPSHMIGKTLAEIEEIVIEETISLHAGSVPKAARTLGVSPSTLYRKRETWQRKR